MEHDATVESNKKMVDKLNTNFSGFNQPALPMKGNEVISYLSKQLSLKNINTGIANFGNTIQHVLNGKSVEDVYVLVILKMISVSNVAILRR